MAGARDGVAIQKEEPLANDVQYVADYYCPEDFFFLTPSASKLVDYKFRCMS